MGGVVSQRDTGRKILIAFDGGVVVLPAPLRVTGLSDKHFKGFALDGVALFPVAPNGPHPVP